MIRNEIIKMKFKEKNPSWLVTNCKISAIFSQHQHHQFTQLHIEEAQHTFAPCFNPMITMLSLDYKKQYEHH